MDVVPITYPKMKRVCESRGYKFHDEGDYNLNIIGLRTDDANANVFNDWIFVAFRQNGNEQLLGFPATTDPGLYWLENPMNVDGTAVLKPGQYPGMFVVGYHQGKYVALVQDRPATVYRDNNRDGRVDAFAVTPQETGVFGINLHRATDDGTSTQVGKWSAGCQVIANSHDFEFFMSLIVRSTIEYGARFSYTLLRESEVWNEF